MFKQSQALFMTISSFVDKAKAQMKATADEKEELAKQKLAEVMGGDLNLITSITFVLAEGKFSNVEAPEHAKDKLRKAGLLIE